MAEAGQKPSRGLALAKTSAKFVAAWAAMLSLMHDERPLNHVVEVLERVTHTTLSDAPAAAALAQNFFQTFSAIILFTCLATLVFGTGLAVLGGVTRMIARARARAGQADFLDRPRHWTTAHPNLTRALLAAPTLLWTLFLAKGVPAFDELPGAYARAVVPLLLAGWGMFALTKKGLRELLAPTIGGTETESAPTIDPHEIAFDAVAITRETLATVALFTAVVLGLPAAAFLRLAHSMATHASSPPHEASFLYVVAYVAFAAVGAFAFRKASRVAVGLDGVHVHGTSRARFFAYRDIDSARANGSDLELVRRGKVVLRLQLHGEDAARRGAVLARITENIARVREGRGATAAQVVASSSKEDLARVVGGAGDYRMATLTREQLWALVEGPEIEASARKAAAEALVRSSDHGERARLRVAAEQCAEPQVRIALQELAEDGMRDVEEPIESRVLPPVG
jgi:hypothetical protein